MFVLLTSDRNCVANKQQIVNLIKFLFYRYFFLNKVTIGIQRFLPPGSASRSPNMRIRIHITGVKDNFDTCTFTLKILKWFQQILFKRWFNRFKTSFLKSAGRMSPSPMTGQIRAKVSAAA